MNTKIHGAAEGEVMDGEMPSEHPGQYGLPNLVSHWRALRVNDAVRVSISDPVPIEAHLALAAHAAATLSDETKSPRTSDMDVLVQAVIIPGDPTKEGQLVQGIAIPWLQILKELERNATFLFQISPRNLEELVAGAYAEQGWEAELTPPSGDRGRDVIVTATLPGIGSVRILDQVKRYASSNPVSANDVRALVGVLSRDPKASKGIITTTSRFAPGVYTEFQDMLTTRLELKNGKRLSEWLVSIAARTI